MYGTVVQQIKNNSINKKGFQETNPNSKPFFPFLSSLFLFPFLSSLFLFPVISSLSSLSFPLLSLRFSYSL
jgi:hypothetical protein